MSVHSFDDDKPLVKVFLRPDGTGERLQISNQDQQQADFDWFMPVEFARTLAEEILNKTKQYAKANP